MTRDLLAGKSPQERAVKEFCYRNNSKSLFRKYSKLVSWLANTGIGRDYLGLPKSEISLMLPNGYEEYGGKGDYRSTFFTRPKYVKKLWPALVAIDRTAQWLHDFEEAKRLLAWELGLTRRMPAVAEAVLFTTSTFYPDPDTEVTSVDGAVRRALVDQTYTNIRAGAGTASGDSVAIGDAWYIQASTTTNQYQGNQRSLYLYDTSSIPDTDTIDSGTHSVFIRTGARYSQVGSFNIALVASTPASNTALASADYGQLGVTRLASDITGVESQYNDHTLNASGLSNISKTGVSKFGIMSSVDFDAGEPTWASGQALSADGISYAETGGSPLTVNDPKLVVVHTGAGAAGGTAAFKSLLGVGL